MQQILNNGAPLLEQRTKINANTTELYAGMAAADAHAASVANPHAVTAAQVGLGSVENKSFSVGVADATHNAATKATPVDADEFPISDSGNSYTIRKMSWGSTKISLRSYFDVIYQPALISGTNIRTVNGSSLLGSGDLTIAGVGGGSISVQDEGAALTTAATSLNFTGGGITATSIGGAVTVSVPAAPVTTVAGRTGAVTLGVADITGAQPSLVSAFNIKTVNGVSLLGSGDMTIAGGGGITTLAAASDFTTAALATLNTSIATAISGKQPALVSGASIKTVNGSTLLGSGDLTISAGITTLAAASDFATAALATGNASLSTALAGKQAALVSASNIKTINGVSVLGSGDMTISGTGTPLVVQDEGATLTSGATSVNFVGAGITATSVGSVVTVTVPGGGSSLAIQDEGSALTAAATSINFVGAGVTAASTGGAATVTVSATINSTDAALRDRATHTGTQLAATISDFSTAADARISANTSVTLSAVTYDGSGRVIGYTRGGVSFVVAYPSSTSITITGGGKVVTITLDGSGRVIGKTVA